jgi:hypothetical protein
MVCAATIRLSRTDMRPPRSAFASIGSTGRSGRQRASSTNDKPSARPPTAGTSARSGSIAAMAESRCPLGRPKKP